MRFIIKNSKITQIIKVISCISLFCAESNGRNITVLLRIKGNIRFLVPRGNYLVAYILTIKDSNICKYLK
jgi:hypothetical protein